MPEVTPNRWGSREVEIRGIRLLNTNRESHLLFHAEDKVELEILYEVLQPDMAPQDEVVFGIAVHRSDGLMVLGTNTDIEGVHLPQLGMSGKIYFSIARLGLLEGSYTLDVAVHRRDGYPYDYQQRALTFAVRWTQKQLGVYLPEHTWRFEPEVGATVRQIQSKVM